MIQKALAAHGVWSDFGKPDSGFRGFHLKEERADATELVVTPVLEQARRFRRHLPLAGTGQCPPLIHALPNLVDNRRGIVLLGLGRKPLPLSKTISSCAAARFRFLGFGIGVMNSARRRRSIIC